MPPKRKSVDKADEAPVVSKKASKTSGDGTPAAARGKGKAKAKVTKSTDGKGSSAGTSPSGGGGAASSGTAERPKRNKAGQLVFPDYPSES